MATACLASLAILAGGLSLIYGLGWYKDRKHKRRINRRVKAIPNQFVVSKEKDKVPLV